MTFTETTPIGFLNYAEAYRRAGRLLATDLTGGGGFDGAPIRFCYYQAIELYLKSFLVSRGVTEGELKGLGHRFRALTDKCNLLGFGLSEASDLATIDNIDRDGNYFGARYIRVGYFTVATVQALDFTAHEVAFLTVAALRGLGLKVREPAPPLPIDFKLQVR